MLDVFHMMDTPGVDVQKFYGNSGTTLLQWQTWRKPRGAKMVMMIGVGGGSSGGCGTNTAATSGGGAGGQSGAQTQVLIPAMFVPDTMYIQAGFGGQQPATLASAATGVAGTPTYVCFEPSTSLTAGVTMLFANGGTGPSAATTTTGGAVGTAGAIAAINAMPLAARGFYQLFSSSLGGAGGTSTTPTAGAASAAWGNVATAAYMVTGGGGGGACGTTASAGGLGFTSVSLGENFPNVAIGAAAVTATPAGAGTPGWVHKNYLNFGGAGGGGATTTAGGNSGAGGDGAPGCGGGGAGGSNTTNTTLARPGNGGPGFVIIVSW